MTTKSIDSIERSRRRARLLSAAIAFVDSIQTEEEMTAISCVVPSQWIELLSAVRDARALLQPPPDNGYAEFIPYWREADPSDYEPHYSFWVRELTKMGLRDKEDVAVAFAILSEQLELRDTRIRMLQQSGDKAALKRLDADSSIEKLVRQAEVTLGNECVHEHTTGELAHTADGVFGTLRCADCNRTIFHNPPPQPDGPRE